MSLRWYSTLFQPRKLTHEHRNASASSETACSIVSITEAQNLEDIEHTIEVNRVLDYISVAFPALAPVILASVGHASTTTGLHTSQRSDKIDT